MDWNEIKVFINPQAADAVANILNEAGASGVVIQKMDKNNDKSDKEKFANLNLTEITEVSAYFPRDDEFKDILSSIKEKVNNLKDCGLNFTGAEYEINFVEERDWSTSWHEFFTTTSIGENFLICPSWIETPDTERTIIEIDPGQAFGVGTHESTQLAVSFLEKYIPEYSSNSHLLDVGVGTGILSIISAKMGIKYVLGVDISEAAINTARVNSKINQVNEQITLLEKDIKEGIQGTYSLISANLLPDIISDILCHLVKYLKEDGIMILSGIILKKESEIKTIIDKQGLKIIDRRQINEWISLVVQKG